MINLGNGKYRSIEEINRALRLKELVKERMTFLKNTTITLSNDKYQHGQEVIQTTLQSLVEESEK